MPSTRMISIAFWIFIGGMLLWQFVAYNHKLDVKVAAAGPQQEHFYFNAQTMAPKPAPKPDGADVRQVSCIVENDKPDPGRFTCHVTLKNQGNMKATNVQVMVAPFQDVRLGDENGRGAYRSLNETDPAFQVSEWVTFPDLAPNQSATQDVSFANGHYPPANSPNPKILFQSEKPKADSPAPQP